MVLLPAGQQGPLQQPSFTPLVINQPISAKPIYSPAESNLLDTSNKLSFLTQDLVLHETLFGKLLFEFDTLNMF